MPGVVKLNPDSVLYNEAGNPIGVILDNTAYRLQVEAKLAAGHGLSLDGNCRTNVSKTLEFTVTTRNELNLPAMSYTITAGKDFYLSFFGGGALMPLSIVLRLKVNGVTSFMFISGRDTSNAIALPMATKIATGGDILTVTVESQVPKGQSWVGFTGIEV